MSSSSNSSSSSRSRSKVRRSILSSLRSSSVPITPTHMREHLLRSRVRDTTQVNYSRGITNFLDWCITNAGLSTDLHELSSLPVQQLDDLLSAFIVSCACTGSSKHSAHMAFWGIRHFVPSLSSHVTCLPQSFQLLRGWDKLQPAVHHPPLTWELTLIIAATMCRWGQPSYAMATLLAFDCYLRCSEFCNLCLLDIALPGDPRLGIHYQACSLRLAQTKRGNNQFVVVSDSRLSALLVKYLYVCFGGQLQHGMGVGSGTQSHGPRVFPFTDGMYRKLFGRVVQSLGLGSIPFVPHSLRGGGATRDHLSGMSIESVLLRGRWESNSSARTYVQSGRALLLTHNVPAIYRWHRMATVINQHFNQFFASFL